MRLLVRKTFTPWIVLAEALFRNHLISTGESPLFTVHMTETKSPEFTGSSPKSKWTIWGGTIKSKELAKQKYVQ